MSRIPSRKNLFISPNKKLTIDDNKIESSPNNKNNTEINTANTTINLSPLKENKKERIDNYGNIIKKCVKKHKITINTNVEIIDVENNKEFNQEESHSLIFDSLSNLPNTCKSCIIM